MSDSGFSMMDLFREEVRTHKSGLSDGLLRLESHPTDPQHLDLLMRAAHSIKGAARIVGVDLAVQLAHAMEDVFVAAQGGKTHLLPADIDVLLRATDVLAELTKLTGEDTSGWAAQHEAAVGELTNELHAMLMPREPVLPHKTTGETPVPPGNQSQAGGTGVSPVLSAGGTGVSPVLSAGGTGVSPVGGTGVS
ncbi:MAG TPA: Hpt domain-containing protein, partial [Gemmataceae bacterium]|nr:Hpt domain-containing protein [Gemmataceae bacterium]